jgi:hypothetical protein
LLIAPRVELAGKVPEAFVEKVARATLTVWLDGELVLKDGHVGESMGSLSGPGPKESPFIFDSRHILFTAHNMQEKLPYGRPVGFFLPRGTMIKATITDLPAIPADVEVRIGGFGSHYSPHANVENRCSTAEECHS